LTLSQLDVVDEALTTLRELGVRLALDDFGTGYSSLATLARVQVHELKIDRAFIAAMDGSAEAAVVRSTIDLGRSLGLQVVAEGVESEEQRVRLWELGCPAGQGHLFARPLTLPRMMDMLQRGYEGRTGAVAAPLHEAGSVIRLPARRAIRRHDETG
jgi:EAL domain-containing protein (putative c-di-GMP-specific phosphodiesterase class I)